MAESKKQERLKALLPTLRERERYVKFKVVSEEQVEYADLEAAIWSTLLEFYGEEGVSRFSFWLIKNLWNQREQTGVLKCNNKSVSRVIAGLGLVSRLGDTRVVFKILGVSGTLQKLIAGRIKKFGN